MEAVSRNSGEPAGSLMAIHGVGMTSSSGAGRGERWSAPAPGLGKEALPGLEKLVEGLKTSREPRASRGKGGMREDGAGLGALSDVVASIVLPARPCMHGCPMQKFYVKTHLWKCTKNFNLSISF